MRIAGEIPHLADFMKENEIYSDVAWSEQDSSVRYHYELEAERERVNEVLKRYYSKEAHAFLWGVWVTLLWVLGRNDRKPLEQLSNYKEYKQKRWGEFKDSLADKLQQFADTFLRPI